MGVEANVGIDPQVAAAVSDFVQGRVIALGVYRVTGPTQIKVLLGLEAQRQLLGCGDNSCITELAGALDARRALSGRLSRIGASTILTLSLLDVRNATVIAQADRRVQIEDTVEPLLDHVAGLVRDVVSRDPEVGELPPPEDTDAIALRHPAAPSSRSTGPSLREIRKDARNGLLIGARAELHGAHPVYAVGVHGQGGYIGMGLAGIYFAPGAEVWGAGARGELRISPVAWKMLAPYLAASGTLCVLPDLPVERPDGSTSVVMRLSPAVHLGVVAAFGHLAAGVDLGYAFETRLIEADDHGPFLEGFTAGMTLQLRL